MPFYGSSDRKFDFDFVKYVAKRILLLPVLGYILYRIILKSMHILCKETMEIHFYFHFNFIIFSILLCEANRKILMNRASLKESAKREDEIKTIVLDRVCKIFKNTSQTHHCDWSDISEEANEITSDENLKRNALHTSANTIIDISFHENFERFPKDEEKTDLIYKQLSCSSQKKFDNLCKLFSDYAADSIFKNDFYEEAPTFEDPEGKIWKTALPLGKDLLKERESNSYLEDHLPDELEEVIVFLYSKAFKATRDILILHSRLVAETAVVLLNNRIKNEEMLVGDFSVPENETLLFDEYSIVKHDSSNLGSD